MRHARIWIALVLALPASAHAYSSHEDFGHPALPGPPPDGGVPDGGTPTPGGGAGRYFTGSPLDGQTCAVCHVGGETPTDATFGGLPPDGYQPDETYRLTLRLPDATRSAGAIEITDEAGHRAGTLELLSDAELDRDDQCDDETQRAAFLTELPEQERTVANVDACGADHLRVDWTAPPENMGAVLVRAVAVAGNGDGRSYPPPGMPDETDGVYTYATILPFYGEQPESTRVTSCAVGPGGGGSGAPLAVVLGAAGLALVRRRR